MSATEGLRAVMAAAQAASEQKRHVNPIGLKDFLDVIADLFDQQDARIAALEEQEEARKQAAREVRKILANRPTDGQLSAERWEG